VLRGPHPDTVGTPGFDADHLVAVPDLKDAAGVAKADHA
jgi:hypothetical protein